MYQFRWVLMVCALILVPHCLFSFDHISKAYYCKDSNRVKDTTIDILSGTRDVLQQTPMYIDDTYNVSLDYKEKIMNAWDQYTDQIHNYLEKHPDNTTLQYQTAEKGAAAALALRQSIQPPYESKRLIFDDNRRGSEVEAIMGLMAGIPDILCKLTFLPVLWPTAATYEYGKRLLEKCGENDLRARQLRVLSQVVSNMHNLRIFCANPVICEASRQYKCDEIRQRVYDNSEKLLAKLENNIRPQDNILSNNILSTYHNNASSVLHNIGAYHINSEYTYIMDDANRFLDPLRENKVIKSRWGKFAETPNHTFSIDRPHEKLPAIIHTDYQLIPRFL